MFYRKDPEMKLQLWRFLSRSLKKAESTYASIEGECLAILFLLRATQIEVMAAKSLAVYTDHQPLIRAIADFNLDKNYIHQLKRLLERVSHYAPTVMYRRNTWLLLVHASPFHVSPFHVSHSCFAPSFLQKINLQSINLQPRRDDAFPPPM